MSKLSARTKALISSRGAALPGSSNEHATLVPLLDRLHSESNIRSSKATLLTLATGTFFAVNSPSGLRSLWKWSGETPKSAQLLREAGLKSISFIGIAKVINNLGVLSQAFEASGVQSELSAAPRRNLTPDANEATFVRGRQLWDSIYRPHHEKLVAKLAAYHPDLPVHILESHYSLLLSDPDSADVPAGPLGRTLTSVLAIACLQGQTGVGSQATSHVFGLKKAMDEPHTEDSMGDVALQGEEKAWLCGDQGNEWILQSIEALREAVHVRDDAEPLKAKL